MRELLFSLIATATGYLLNTAVNWWKGHRRTKGQAAILHGFEGPTKFVFPHREDSELAILPRISTEDFMAINNIISAFLAAEISPPSKMVDCTNITEADKCSNNLILICSSKTNPVTAEALSLLRQNHPQIADYIPEFAVDEKTGHTFIRWNQGKYVSKSFYQDQNGPLEDIAIILKAKSPWASQYNILVVAGIRGIGTWGAAECLKKSWEAIYAEKGADKKTGASKQGSFVALENISFSDYDIKPPTLIDLKDLDIKDAC
ncbi:MAG: hypothetical protein SWH61_06535 [Thermodesulfobacteriota bacterium]|nr:hypothetical protein [Thermodesulfobacteriota bacterium]